ncbi:MAG: DUF294 nucleotidyltransferase-like domain-containing protein [Lentisphaeria bacterium]|nr:DUF294 nucleotidyltransferase-like domain-containing protein [Lentisphaeria bacterium]
MPKFILRIIIPTLLTFALFTVAIFAVLLPALRETSMARKREMIRELTHSAWNILANFEAEAREGILTEADAQAEAIRQFRHLHYGNNNKEYFWLNDLTPRMIAHPYRQDLEGQDLGAFTDPTGRAVFVDMVTVVQAGGEGYVSYFWQDRDDPERIVPKVSYVKLFEPWGWVVGTGIYVDDVEKEIAGFTRRLGLISLFILLVTAGLLNIIAVESLRTEKKREQAREALRKSETRYRTLVESAGGNIFMVLEGEPLYANASALTLLGYTAEEAAELHFDDIAEMAAGEDPDVNIPRTGDDVPARQEASLVRKDGRRVDVTLAYSRISIGPRRGFIAVATDITERKAAEKAAGKTEEALRESLDQFRDRDMAHQRQARHLEETVCQLRSAAPEDLFAAQREKLAQAKDPAAVAACSRAFNRLLGPLISTGLRPDLGTRLLSRNTDAVSRRLIDLGLEQLGEAPVGFAWMVMGSEARYEQTFCTDQDNAIVFEDVPRDQMAPVREYFMRLGAFVCDGLAAAGYTRCTGDLMACNSQWVRSASEWEKQFRHWVSTLEARELMNSKIFFDFRAVRGRESLVDQLRDYVRQTLTAHPRFFPQLARNMLFYEPPIGLFGNLRLQSASGRSRGFDIKAAMIPLVDYARLYALKNNIPATSTVDRLEELRRRELLDEDTVRDATAIFESLMKIRLENQVRRSLRGENPDNWIAPSRLNGIDRRVIKTALAHIRTLQRSMSYDFFGQVGVPQ